MDWKPKTATEAMIAEEFSKPGGFIVGTPEEIEEVRRVYEEIKHHLPSPLEIRRRAQGMNGWQPIETAPKDGTHLLLWLAEGEEEEFEPATAIAAAFQRGMWRMLRAGDSFVYGKPTHWMPLPPLPPAD